MSDSPDAAANHQDYEAKIQFADERKAEGNEHFKAALAMKAPEEKKEREKLLRKALGSWHSALFYLSGLDRNVLNAFGGAQAQPGQDRDAKTPGEAKLADIGLKVAVLHNNMAACHIQLENWPRAAACAQKALDKDPENTKAKLRLATALGHEGSVIKAQKLLVELKEKTPDDAAVLRELKALSIAEKQREKRSEATFKGMFNRPSPSAAAAAAKTASASTPSASTAAATAGAQANESA